MTSAIGAAPFDVVVIGGGQAGLAVGYPVTRRGMRSRPGHICHEERRGIPRDDPDEALLTSHVVVATGPSQVPFIPQSPATWMRRSSRSIKDGSGGIIHRRGVTGSPGAFFIGLTWQHTRGSALIGFVKDDAAFIAGCIHTRLENRTGVLGD